MLIVINTEMAPYKLMILQTVVWFIPFFLTEPWMACRDAVLQSKEMKYFIRRCPPLGQEVVPFMCVLTALREAEGPMILPKRYLTQILGRTREFRILPFIMANFIS